MLTYPKQFFLSFALYLCIELLFVIVFFVFDSNGLPLLSVSTFVSIYWQAILFFLLLAGIVLFGTLLLYFFIVNLVYSMSFKPNIYFSFILFTIIDLSLNMFVFNNGTIVFSQRFYEINTVNVIIVFILWFRKNMFLVGRSFPKLP